MLRFGPCLLIALAAALSSSPMLAGQTQLPSFDKVEQCVQDHFASQSGREPNDLITRRDVQRVLDELKKLGWEVSDRKEIVEAALADDDWLAKRLQTNAGRKFMREMSSYPDGYDKLDRLRRLPDGQRILDRLIKGPDGYKMIDYLANEPGGREMGRMLSKAPKGKDFNQSTGRIYSADELVKRLKQSYEAAQQGTSARRR
jgi:hypothetical protein